MPDKFIPLYDLESLNETQRQEYIKNVCNHMGVPPELNLVMLTYLDEQDDPRRLVAYAKRGATEIIRNNRGINITEMRQERVGGSIVWTVTAKDNQGRQEMSSGAKWIEGLAGKELDDAIMTGQTRACRRVTLQFVGAGVLDESEVNPQRTVQTQQATPLPIAPLPTVEPSAAPGYHVIKPEIVQAATEMAIRGHEIVVKPLLETFSEEQAKLRADAIAQLNAKETKKNEPIVEQPVEEKPKIRRGRKPKVDFGPSEPVPTQANPVVSINPAAATSPVATIAMQASAPIASFAPAAVQPPVPNKAKLTPEQVKPFRQRLFKIVNDQLEPAGFAPKEGIGNSDKMRSLATIMFSGVSSMNELSVVQWEQYLAALEARIANFGAVETIKYIEDAIGI